MATKCIICYIGDTLVREQLVIHGFQTPRKFSLTKLLLLFFYVVVSLFGLYKLKTAEIGINWEFVLGVVFYGSGFLLWIAVLRVYPLSIAFPLAAGSLIVGTQLIGVRFLGEPFDLASMLAIGLILAGLVVLASTSYYKGQ